MSRITTHVLDTVLGKPAAGIEVRLERRGSREWTVGEEAQAQDARGAWLEAGRSATDADGRCLGLAPNAEAGTYRLIFETAAYLARTGRKSIYPEISIVFFCSGEEHYHLPLLLSDNSYTTYRGS